MVTYEEPDLRQPRFQERVSAISASERLSNASNFSNLSELTEEAEEQIGITNTIKDKRGRIGSGAYKGTEATIKKNRVVIGSILLSSILLMMLITFLPFWISVHKEGAHGATDDNMELYFTFGPYSMQFHGIMHSTTSMLAECSQAEAQKKKPLITVRGCHVLRDVDYVGHVVLGSYLAILVGIVYGTIHLLVGRVRMAVVYWFASILATVSVTQIFFSVGRAVAQEQGFKATTGTCSTLFVIVASLVGLDVLLVMVLWFMARDEWSTMGVDVYHLRHHSMPGSNPRHKLKYLAGKKMSQFKKKYNQVNAPEYDRDVHMCGLGYCYALTESGFMKDRGWTMGILLFLATVPIHFLKTFDWGPIRMSWFGPKSEMESIRKHGKVTSTIVVNYMLYRRSNMISVVAFGLPLWISKLGELCHRWSEISSSVEETKRISFTDWSKDQETPSMQDYTSMVTDQILKSLATNFNANAVFKNLIHVGLLGMAVVCGAIATKRWYNFVFTRSILNLGFIALLSSAFMQSFAGFGGTHDFNNVNILVEGYVNDLKEHVNARDWMQKCVNLNFPLMVATATIKLQAYCPKIPEGVWDMRGITGWPGGQMGAGIAGVHDFRVYRTYCEYAKNITEREETEEAAQFTHAACKLLEDLMYNGNSTPPSRHLKSIDGDIERKERNSPLTLSQERQSKAKDRLAEIQRLDAKAEELAVKLAKVRAESISLKRKAFLADNKTFPMSARASSFAEVPAEAEECVKDTQVFCGPKHKYFSLAKDDCPALDATCSPEGVCQCKPDHCWAGGLYTSKCMARAEMEKIKEEARLNATKLIKKYKMKFDFEPERIKGQLATATIQLESIVGTVEDTIDGLSNLCALMNLIAAIGPGMVIAAMTVKLIFVNSALPGKFIIAFPIFYCPAIFAYYGLAWVVVRDAEFAFVMIIWSFWPILVSIASKWTGFHLPMSDERAMFMANYMLVAYYFWIILSYVVILRYALFWSPRSEVEWWEPEVLVRSKPREMIFAYLAGMMHDGVWFYLLCDNFVTYFLTCLAVGDFFIVATVQEHKYAYNELLLGEDSITIGASKKPVVDTLSNAVYRSEKEMIDDWCTLIGGVLPMVGLTGKPHDEEPELLEWDPERAPGQNVMFSPGDLSPSLTPSETSGTSFERVEDKEQKQSQGAVPISFDINVQEVQRKHESYEVIDNTPTHATIEMEDMASPFPSTQEDTTQQVEKSSSLNGLQEP